MLGKHLACKRIEYFSSFLASEFCDIHLLNDSLICVQRQPLSQALPNAFNTSNHKFLHTYWHQMHQKML